jgi:Rab3 GTPase-activating protein non-catalytic subunit
MGCSIYAAPCHYQIAAITDSLGRIILVDTCSGVLIRMWKGYREAQCGFMDITEAKNRKDQSSDYRRSGLFLIIYAPRKGIIEIWCMQKGPKVATFQASKNGFLIYNSHDVSPIYRSSKTRNSRTSCLFFDADDNSLKNFSIPFHCILSETNSKSAEDFHFLKRLKSTLKSIHLKEASAITGVIEICEKFQTPEIKLKCLELLTTYRKTEPIIIREVIELFLRSHVDEPENEDEKHEAEIQDEIYRNQLKASCLNYKSLVDCYLMVREKYDEAMEESEDNEATAIANESIELLNNEYLTVQRIVELMSLTKTKELSHKNVSFKDNEDSIVSFLSSFIVNASDSIILNTEHHQNSLDQIGSVLFLNAWKGDLPASKLQDVFNVCRISNDDIMKCFLHFWLSQEINFIDEDHVLAEMTKFKNILDEVCDAAGDKVTYAYNSICLFWQDVREYLLESDNPINALLAAIICKNYALKKQDESQDFGFEQVTQEECQWTLLTEKLNDVAVLSIFVSQFVGKEKFDVPSISLKKILNDGKGIISELVSSWLIGVNLPIGLIFKTSADENLEKEEKNVIKKLEILRQHFPYSLNASVILCYVIWELLSKRWSKNLSEIHFLKSGIEHLALFDEKDFHLKQGLCVMLWNANFKIPLKATQKLINKTGRLPKEKLCLQNTMIPDFLIPQFLEQTLIFLDHFRNSIGYTKLEFKCEEILEQGSPSQSLSLCELVLNQQRGNLPLLNLHFEMLKVLELIAFLNIKYTKPMQSLFDDVANEAFFTDICKQMTYPLHKADEIRQNTRVYFLKKAISTTIDLIIECQQNTYFDDHLKWIEKIKIVGNIWELDIGLLERHHVSLHKKYFEFSKLNFFLGRFSSFTFMASTIWQMGYSKKFHHASESSSNFSTLPLNDLRFIWT